MNRLVSVTSPLARITQPKVMGIERVPEKGAMLVGNHTLFGLIDVPFMMSELWSRRRIVVRGLGDHRHYALPVWRDLLEMSGMVRGTRENVHALMQEDQNVLVFPGGAGEVFKSRGEKYRLKWKERLGFARLAIEHQYSVVPFAAVGVEEMFDVVADKDTPVVSQVSSLMKRLVGVPLPPIVRGVGATLLPRPERLYFWFGEPIDTLRFAGRADDDDAARALRDDVKAAVEGGIETLLAERERDPNRSLTARLQRVEEDLPELAASDPDAWFVVRAFEAWNTSGPEGAAAWMSRRVRLVDPPQWPDSDVWAGRSVAIERLAEVTEALGAGWAEVTDARTLDGTVLASFALREHENSTVVQEFHALVRVESEQIAEMRIFVDRDEALVSRATDARGNQQARPRSVGARVR